MHGFGNVEVRFNWALRHLVKMRTFSDQPHADEVLRAIMGGMRFDPLRSTVRRILSVTAPDPKVSAEIERILTHVGHMHQFRDMIAHNTARPEIAAERGWFRMDNFVNIRTQEQGEHVWFHLDSLYALIQDIEFAPYLFDLALTPGFPARTELDERVAEFGAWRYRPDALIRTGPKHPANRVKPGHPLRSWAE